MQQIKKIISIIKSFLQGLKKKVFNKLPFLRKVCEVAKHLLPSNWIGTLDWYIIKKFIGTYIFAILLIISIAIVFDFNENLSKFTQYHAPWRAIIFDYYANFIPYYSNLFSPLFVFIAVIFFTSKLAGNSEVIAMLAAGVSFKRLMRPYMISCILISVLTFTKYARLSLHICKLQLVIVVNRNRMNNKHFICILKENFHKCINGSAYPRKS